MLACVLLDHFLMNRAQCGWFKFYDLKIIFFYYVVFTHFDKYILSNVYYSV
jgi:hypothetical protein